MHTPTPPARYDIPWKIAIGHALRAFTAFFFADVHARIDWSKRPRFRDKELAKIGFGNAPDHMIADKLVEVCLRDGSAEWILLHIEVQAQRDAKLTQRVLDYNYRISNEYGRPVTSLVLLADDVPGWHPQAFHHEQLGFEQHLSFGTAKLLDYAAHIDTLLTSHNPFAWLTLVHLGMQHSRHNPEQLYTDKLRFTGLLFKHRWSRKRIIILFKAMNWMMTLPQPHQRRFWQSILQLEEERNMKLMNSLEQMFFDDGMEKGLERGLEQGLERGLEKGRKEGVQTVLEQQLTQRFGPLPKTVHSRLSKASVEQLTAWAVALPTAQSLKQVFQ